MMRLAPAAQVIRRRSRQAGGPSCPAEETQTERTSQREGENSNNMVEKEN